MKLQMFTLAPFRFTNAVRNCMHAALNSASAPFRWAIAVQSFAIAFLGFASSAQAHEGHGMPGVAHWHASDVWGFIVVGGLVAYIVWMKGRK